MSNDILNILYTPLDVPPVPSYNKEDLKKWCVKNSNQKIVNRENEEEWYEKKGIPREDNYPWKIAHARENFQWIDNFNIHFRELSEYFCSTYLLKEEDVSGIVLAPVKPNYTGATYWHTDPDEIGLRLYLENNEIDRDFLLIKPTVEKYKRRAEIGYIPPDGNSDKIQNVIHSAKIMKIHQAFYINNVRAIHTVNVEVSNSNRFAVLILTKFSAETLKEETKKLILDSAEKFSDYSIKWDKK